MVELVEDYSYGSAHFATTAAHTTSELLGKPDTAVNTTGITVFVFISSFRIFSHGFRTNLI